MPLNSDLSNLTFSLNPTSLDVKQANSDDINDDTSLTTVTNNIRYVAGTADSGPTGSWIVNDQRASAGTIVMAFIFAGWTAANSKAQAHLVAMAANTALSKAGSALSQSLTSAVNAGQSLSYSDLVTMVTPHLQGTNMTATQFLQAALPTATQNVAYQGNDLQNLQTSATQYSSGRLNDNSVLQQQYDIATASINQQIEAITNVLKGWSANLQTLGRNL